MRKFMIAVAALALAGCVTTDTAMLDSRTAIISGRGNAFANTAQLQREMLLEAAKVGSERGFTHFAVLGAQDQSKVDSFTTPSRTNTTGSAYGSCTGNFCNAYGSSQTTTTPGNTTTFVKPGADMTVRYLYANEVQPGNVWNIADILSVNAPDEK